MSYAVPTISDFKSYFTRDFPFGNDASENILDTDISRAITEAGVKINPSLFGSQSEFTVAYNYLAAHILCMLINQSSQGINSKFDWPYSSKSVGSISVSQSIPDGVLKNPMYGYYAKTAYGVEYLIIVYPKLIGNMFTIEGATTP